MQVQVKKLRETLALLQPVLPRKSSVPVFQYILLKNGMAVATDNEKAVILKLAEAQEALLLSRAALDILEHIPGNAIAEVTQQGKVVTITAESFKSTLVSSFPDDYPEVLQMPEVQVRLDGEQLLKAISMAIGYAAGDTTRPVLHGITLTMEDSTTWVSAGDGFSMLYKEVPGKFTYAERRQVIIPRDTVDILERLWKKSPKPVNPEVDSLLADLALAKHLVELGFTSSNMGVRWGNVTLISKLVQGTAPNWKQLLPGEPASKVKVYVQDFFTALSQVKQVSTNSIIRLRWSGDTMKVSAKGDDNEALTSIPVTVEGEPEGCIALDLKYLWGYLKPRDGFVEMGVNSTTGPVRLLDGQCIVLVMPMSVQWDDAPAPTAVVQAEAVVAEETGDPQETGETDGPENWAEEEPGQTEEARND